MPKDGGKGKKKKKRDTSLVHSYKERGKCCLGLMDNPTGATVGQAGPQKNNKGV